MKWLEQTEMRVALVRKKFSGVLYKFVELMLKTCCAYAAADPYLWFFDLSEASIGNGLVNFWTVPGNIVGGDSLQRRFNRAS